MISTRLRLREPQGERAVEAPLLVTGEGPAPEGAALLLVPGVHPGQSLELRVSEDGWEIDAQGAAGGARLNGGPLRGTRELATGDVIHFGDAQLLFQADAEGASLLALHGAGNATIAPVDTVPLVSADVDAAEIEIDAAPLPRPAIPAARGAEPRERRRSRPVAFAIAAGLLLAVIGIAMLFALQSVPLDLSPQDAKVEVLGLAPGVHSGTRLFTFAGERRLRATRAGYFPAEQRVAVGADAATVARLHLTPRPGVVAVDTQGVTAEVLVDGAAAGTAPGDVEVPAGRRVLTLRAPKHLDYIAPLDVRGAGERQELAAQLQPSWGSVEVRVESAGATLEVDGQPAGSAPATLELEAGVHELRVSAPQRKPWVSRVAVNAGERIVLGPLVLGEPDAVVAVRSSPAGAEVTVTGAYRGRTPLDVALPAGAAHELAVHLAGYRSVSRPLRVAAGERTAVNVTLEPELVPVTIRGEPADAQIAIDGTPRGQAPLTLSLTAAPHRIDARKAGYADWTLQVTPATGLERQVEYRLVTVEDARRGQALADTLQAKSGGALRLVSAGSFMMGSERREQGRRPNEGLRRVTLSRAFYIGRTEVTNGEFRQFRKEHASGIVDKQTLDLDRYPVTSVSWSDAIEYCNWLSQQDGLPAAYERVGSVWTLHVPVNTGYRLPTEAEWEYAARYVDGQRFRRYAWGDSLPIPARAGNFSGEELRPPVQPGRQAAQPPQPILPGHRDEHPALAPVGTYGESALGLADIAGNVAEWTHDFYLSFVDAAAVTDPLGPASGTPHSIRGSSWKSAAIADLRLASREGAAGGSQSIGFRVARYAE